MIPVLMKTKTDCEVSAIATACGVSYEKAKEALEGRTSPGLVLGNPLNLYRALTKLGFWKKNITLSDLLDGKARAGKTIVLLHDQKNPNLSRHWAVYGGPSFDFFQFYWGDKPDPRLLSRQQMANKFRKGFPNCAFQVYPASFWRLMLEKLKAWF